MSATLRQLRIRAVEAATCPRRVGELGPWDRGDLLDSWETGNWASTKEEADAEVAEFMAANPKGSIGNVFWNYGGEQPRKCSFCGSVHPDDAVALIKAGWEVGGTTKAYKRYLEPSGYRAYCDALRDVGFNRELVTLARVQSPVPCVKLYTMHFSPEQIAAFNAAIDGQRA